MTNRIDGNDLSTAAWIATVSIKRVDDPDAEWQGPFECTSFEAVRHQVDVGMVIALKPEDRRYVVQSVSAHAGAGKRVAQWKTERSKFKR